MGLVQGFKNLFIGEDDADEVEFRSEYSRPGAGFGERPEGFARTSEGPSRSSESFGRAAAETSSYESRSYDGFSGEKDRRESDRRMNTEQTQTLQIVLARPVDFSEVRDIGDDINDLKTVILNLEMVKSEDAKRILDFLSGVAYANKAQIKMMAQKTFAIMSRNVKFDGKDLMSELENNGYSF